MSSASQVMIVITYRKLLHRNIYKYTDTHIYIFRQIFKELIMFRQSFKELIWNLHYTDEDQKSETIVYSYQVMEQKII